MRSARRCPGGSRASARLDLTDRGPRGTGMGTGMWTPRRGRYRAPRGEVTRDELSVQKDPIKLFRPNQHRPNRHRPDPSTAAIGFHRRGSPPISPRACGRNAAARRQPPRSSRGLPALPVARFAPFRHSRRLGVGRVSWKQPPRPAPPSETWPGAFPRSPLSEQRCRPDQPPAPGPPFQPACVSPKAECQVVSERNFLGQDES